MVAARDLPGNSRATGQWPAPRRPLAGRERAGPFTAPRRPAAGRRTHRNERGPGPLEPVYRSTADEVLETVVVGQKSLGKSIKSGERIPRLLETDLDAARLDRDTGRQAVHAARRLRGYHGNANRSRTGLMEILHETVTTVEFTPERTSRNSPLERAKQTRPPENENSTGQLSAEQTHQRRGMTTGNTEQFLQITTSNQIAIQPLQLFNRIRKREQPADRGRHRSVPEANPRIRRALPQRGAERRYRKNLER